MWKKVRFMVIFVEAQKKCQNDENSKFLMTKKIGNKSNRFRK
jgi:hypothetical protein